jgi:hypothetical protein
MGDRSEKLTLLESGTTVAAAASKQLNGGKAVFQAMGTTSAGAGSATIEIQGSLDDTNWVDLGTISLTLSTTSATDGFAIDAPWEKVRANVTAISGTDASVTVLASVEV